MEDRDEEAPVPKGYINTNIKLDKVKKQIRMVLTHLFLLWTIRATVSSRADYGDRAVKFSFEDVNFLWTNEPLIGFLQKRQSNYEILDATSKIQDRVIARTPKEKKFLVAVLLGIFCSITTAQLVEDHLDAVLKARTLKKAVEVFAQNARRVCLWKSVAIAATTTKRARYKELVIYVYINILNTI